MSNPFDLIDSRLNTIEKLLVDIKHGTPVVPQPEIEKPITQSELCDFLHVTEPTVIRWKKRGKIPFIQVGARVLFQKSEVLKALEGKRCK